ncbi:unnamed protein product, partial [Didymodactylos carnosus]
GRNALPLSIGITSFLNTVQTSTSTDSGHSSHLRPNNTKPTTTTSTSTTSSSTAEQTLIVPSEKIVDEGEEQKSQQRYALIDSSLSSMVKNNFKQSSYINRGTLLHALTGCGDNINYQQINMKVKKFCLRSNKSSSCSPSLNNENDNNCLHINTKYTPPFILHSSTTNSPIDSLEKLLPKVVHINDNCCWSSYEEAQNINGGNMNVEIDYSPTEGGENSSGKCLILTQNMLTGSCQSDDICSKSSPSSYKNQQTKIFERKSFTEEDFRQLLLDKDTTKENSLSTTNEELSSFSWNESDKTTSDKKQKFKHNKNYHVPVIMCQNDQLLIEEKIKTPPSHIRSSLDCYFPRQPSDLSFTVNMSTTEDEQSTETKSTLVSTTPHTYLKATSPVNMNVTASTCLTPKKISPISTDVIEHPVEQCIIYQKKKSTPVPLLVRHSRLKPPMVHHRNKPSRNLARKLIEETSDTSEISLLDSIDEKYSKVVEKKKNNNSRGLWKENYVYTRPLTVPKKDRVRLSSSYSNLLDLLQREEECSHNDQKYLVSPSETNELLQRWLQDQLIMFEHQVKQQLPTTIQNNSDSDNESDTISENTFTQKLPLFNSTTEPTNTEGQLNNNNDNKDSPHRYNRIKHKQQPVQFGETKKVVHSNVRYKILRKAHLVRHESLKNRNRPLLLSSSFLSPQSSTNHHRHHTKIPCNNIHETCHSRNNDSSEHISNHSYCDKDVFCTDSSMPRSDTSDFSQPQLSESVISNLESEYDNYQPEQQMSNSQILSDDDNRSYL